jgi:hypothetical protein
VTPHPHVLGLTHETWSYIVWGIWAVGLFVAIEFTSRDQLGWAPWFTLSQTAKTLIRDHPWIGLLLIYAFITLFIHILFPENKWGL